MKRAHAVGTLLAGLSDTSPDSLYGGDGKDWFFGPDSEVKDFSAAMGDKKTLV